MENLPKKIETLPKEVHAQCGAFISCTCGISSAQYIHFNGELYTEKQLNDALEKAGWKYIGNNWVCPVCVRTLISG